MSESFDITRYLGIWYEIAKIPIVCDTSCILTMLEDTITCEYQLLSPSAITVINTCYMNDRVVMITEGIGYMNNKSGVFTIDYPDYGLPTYGNYIVHSTDYDTYALVGNRTKRQLWVLSRLPTMDIIQYIALLEIATDIGYNTYNVISNRGAVQ